MYELTHVVLLVVALAAMKRGLLDRQAEISMFGAASVFWAAVTYGSFNVQPSFGSADAIAEPALFAIGLGGLLVSIALTVLAALDRLPEPNITNQPHTIE